MQFGLSDSDEGLQYFKCYDIITVSLLNNYMYSQYVKCGSFGISGECFHFYYIVHRYSYEQTV